VDAAYAGRAAIVPEFQPFSKAANAPIRSLRIRTNGCSRRSIYRILYCRHTDLLKRAFALVPEYLKTDEAVTNQMDYGIQLGRRFRALKLWFVIRYFGRDGLIDRIREHCRLAQLLARWIEESDDWELTAPVNFALVCFRACPKNAGNLDALNERLMNEINASGKAYLSHTRLNDRFTLRLSIGNIRVEERHIKKVWNLLNENLKAQAAAQTAAL
jgi:aromatic-L-amino-acid decarboxylase